MRDKPKADSDSTKRTSTLPASAKEPATATRSARQSRKRMVLALLDWFRTNARDLPWRRTTNPYAIWVSEIMLQQTQVQTVVPFWIRWMQRIPDVQALAQADPKLVLKLWEGLGYYTRARHLQKAAHQILEQHQGRFPNRYEDVLALPGIGRYTAGAICSIAFDQPTPVLDGNVIRVLARLFGIADPVKVSNTKERLWALARELVETAHDLREAAGRPCSHLNQALMELGATVCTPRQPTCRACPLHRSCAARRGGQIALFPNLAKRPEAEARRFVAFAVLAGDRFLVGQRPPGVLNGQLWEFPHVELAGDVVDPTELAARLFGSKGCEFHPLCTIRHSITRYRIQLDAFRVVLSTAGARPEFTELTSPIGAATIACPLTAVPAQERWCTPAELEALAFPSAHRKLLRALNLNQPGQSASERVAAEVKEFQAPPR